MAAAAAAAVVVAPPPLLFTLPLFLLFFADSATSGDFHNLGDFLGVLVGVLEGTTW